MKVAKQLQKRKKALQKEVPPYLCRQIPGTAEEKGLVDAFFQKNRHLKKEWQIKAWILRGLTEDDCVQARDFREALHPTSPEFTIAKAEQAQEKKTDSQEANS